MTAAVEPCPSPPWRRPLDTPRLHDLRRGVASVALQVGADLKVVQDQLSQSSIVVTIDTYVSILPEHA